MHSNAFRNLWFGQALANMGDIFYIVGLISLVYDLTGSAVYMTAVPLVITFSRFISSMAAPLLLNRTQMKSLIAYSQMGKTFFLCVFLMMMVLGTQNVWIYLSCASIISFLDGWALPARNAYVPFLVKREELMGANGFLSTVDQTIQFSSWALGGILLAVLNATNLFIVVILLFLASTFFMLKLPVIPSSTLEVRKVWWQELGEGWSQVKSRKGLVHVFWIYGLESISGTVWIAAVLYLYVDLSLQRGEEWWGFINSSFFVGLVLASYLIFKLHGIFSKHRHKWLPFCMIVTSSVTLVFAWNKMAVMALILSFVFGLFDQIKNVVLQTYLQESAPPEELGKIYAAQGALTTLLFGLSSVGVGLLLEVMSVSMVFTWSALLLLTTLIPVKRLQKNLDT
ncbi:MULTISPECIES: MFS transporter [unclassified Rossellomorea]|uniref:MFS transporter n=1 Tax=unclassified Rossellomorea TaxID=2837526 RepID=UPI0020C6323B|nr:MULTISPECIES: MFS transporter [unclassified Rossellomorea]UTE78964.1 MFS transporter [Rossellomorea sp. KS-H15a]WGG47023.1 MFS transporter [Rossellomorea sp. DA94]